MHLKTVELHSSIQSDEIHKIYTAAHAHTPKHHSEHRIVASSSNEKNNNNKKKTHKTSHYIHHTHKHHHRTSQQFIIKSWQQRTHRRNRFPNIFISLKKKWHRQTLGYMVQFESAIFDRRLYHFFRVGKKLHFTQREKKRGTK